MTDTWSLKLPGEPAFEFSDEAGIFLRSAPELQSYDIESNDISMDGVDGTAFGVDTIGAATYALSFGVEGATSAEARDREGALKRMWRGDSVRRASDVVGELVSDRGRSSFGRPRRIATSAARYWDIPPQADVSADWRAADPLWYGATQVESVGLVPTPTGGLRAPLSAPLTVGNGPGSRSTPFDVDTEVATWSRLRVTGPIVDPAVSFIGPAGVVRYAFRTTLAYDDAILITTVPWARGAIRESSGGTVPVAPGSSRYDAGALATGRYELVLEGTAPTGSPRAFIEWREAHTTP